MLKSRLQNTRLYIAVTNVFNTATLDIFQMGQPILGKVFG